ncbi:MAG: aldehyde ferredoxin oxidoreductase C-terminal domain-containing protein, partial [Synergistaceae bacterium]|nr:aldehyde ferredoxin oxidoreductase C-terminal domain-containing protein [Synergistaceae bacterium]
GERIFNLKRLYNTRHGIGRKDDTLPERILSTPRGDDGTGSYTPDLGPMLDEYYRVRGWDENGVPRPETVARLGLEEKYF